MCDFNQTRCVYMDGFRCSIWPSCTYECDVYFIFIEITYCSFKSQNALFTSNVTLVLYGLGCPSLMHWQAKSTQTVVQCVSIASLLYTKGHTKIDMAERGVICATTSTHTYYIWYIWLDIGC